MTHGRGTRLAVEEESGRDAGAVEVTGPQSTAIGWAEGKTGGWGVGLRAKTKGEGSSFFSFSVSLFF